MRNEFDEAGVTCTCSVRKSQIAVAKSTKPSTVLTVSIQRPGRGRTFENDGMNVMTRYGSASPRPMTAKIVIVFHAGTSVPSATAAAVPRNGAEHGVERSAAKRPFTTEPRNLSSSPPSAPDDML